MAHVDRALTLGQRLAISAGAVIVYAAVFPYAARVYGARATALGAVPVFVAGWMLGLRGAVAYWVFHEVMDTLLLNLTGAARGPWALLSVWGPIELGLAPALAVSLGWAGDILRRMSVQDRELVVERERLQEETARRMKAEQASRTADERLRAMVTNLPVILFSLDRFGSILLGEGKGLAPLGERMQKTVGQSAFEVFRSHPDIPRHLLRAIAGQPVSTTISVFDRVYQVEFSPARDASGAVEAIHGAALDITERTQAEAGFRSLIESTPDAILVHREGVILYANPAALVLLGHDQPGELVGKAIAGVLPEGAAGEVTLDARSRPVSAEVVSIPVTFEGQTAILSIVRDVTARKETQARLMLADRMASVGLLAGGVAHEINNPLAYVVANLDEALAKLGPGDARDLLEVARQGAERVVKIVRDLRTLSGPEAQALRDVDLRAVLDLAVDVTANEIRHRAVVRKEYGAAPMVRAVQSQLAQVFINLIVNAAQAIPEGRAEQNTIRVATGADAQGRALVEIEDTGAGIPPENLRRLFAPFFTTKPVGVGTGLGLFVCQNIVHALGGGISVESTVGKGTTVRVLLPGAGEALPAAPPPALPAAAHAARGRVLVVDDEALVATAIRRALQHEHEVVVAGGGRQALEILGRDDRFDVIVCDLMMPDVTGMDLHDQIRRDRPGMERKMVFVSGGAFTPRAHDFLASVDNPRLDKPFASARLREVVREVAARTKAA